jgi:hypothetical protein
MHLPPSGHGLGRTGGHEGERSTPLEINQDGSIGLPCPQGPVVDAEPLRYRTVRKGQTMQQAQEGVATGAQAWATAHSCPCRPRQL